MKNALYSAQYEQEQQYRFAREMEAREAKADDYERWNDELPEPRCVIQIMCSTPIYTPKPCGECHACKRK